MSRRGGAGVAHSSDMVTIIYPQGCREVRFTDTFAELFLVLKSCSQLFSAMY